LSNIYQETSRALNDNHLSLSQAVVDLLYAQQPQEWGKYGAKGRAASLRDMGFHLAYLSVAIETETPMLFEDYISWARVLFDGINLPPETLTRTLEATRVAARQQLAPEMAAVIDLYIKIACWRLQEPPSPPPIFIDERLPLGGLAKDYLDALLRGDRHAAAQMILDAHGRGVDVRDLYLFVFQRVLYEEGRLWQTSQISVAQEHFSTYVTQQLMSQLNRGIERSRDLGRRMVADFFEMAGWEPYYLGGNTPAESVLRTLVEQRADLLVISVTITAYLSQAEELIARVREIHGGQVKILVGGYPFNLSETLWQTVGADGFGRDAQHALEVANRLVGGRSLGL
jgi:methanogenic corrinoid protein MtbC1